MVTNFSNQCQLVFRSAFERWGTEVHLVGPSCSCVSSNRAPSTRMPRTYKGREGISIRRRDRLRIKNKQLNLRECIWKLKGSRYQTPLTLSSLLAPLGSPARKTGKYRSNPTPYIEHANGDNRVCCRWFGKRCMPHKQTLTSRSSDWHGGLYSCTLLFLDWRILPRAQKFQWFHSVIHGVEWPCGCRKRWKHTLLRHYKGKKNLNFVHERAPTSKTTTGARN